MRRAVDIVLLPPTDMMDKAIDLNKELIKTNDSIILNKENCLPHISLAMGVVSAKDINKIKIILGKIAKQFLPLELKINKIYTKELPNGKFVSGLEIDKAERLQFLHETVLRDLKGFFSYNLNKEMLFNPSEIEEITLRIIKDYPTKSSFEKFYPHITVGLGNINDASTLNLPLTFTAERLAMCQLGNYCTCRKILIETTKIAKEGDFR